jgi:hypothetical protein
MKLLIHGIQDLVLDAGTVSEKKDNFIISPPTNTMFDQIWNWLESHPRKYFGYNNWAFGIGATALCYRWGTYLAALMDENKPIHPHAGASHSAVSMISQNEMMRINIEASSNLARLLEKLHKDEHNAIDFILRAYDWLPMPQKQVKRKWEAVAIIYKTLEIYKDHLQEYAKERSEQAVKFPYRSLANTITVLAYRNGEVENVHAGKGAAYSLDHRRFTQSQSRKVVRGIAEHLSALFTAKPLWQDNLSIPEKWPSCLAGLPYVMFYPYDWSLSQLSSEIIHNKEWCK